MFDYYRVYGVRYIGWYVHVPDGASFSSLLLGIGSGWGGCGMKGSEMIK